jgi:hypothetical protein
MSGRESSLVARSPQSRMGENRSGPAYRRAWNARRPVTSTAHGTVQAASTSARGPQSAAAATTPVKPETPAACAYHLFDNSGTMEQNLAQDTGTADKSEMAALIGTGVTEHLDTIDDGGDDGTLAAAPSSVGYMSGDDWSTVQPETNSQVESDVNTAINAQAGDTGAGGITADDLVAGLEDAQAALEACENDNKVLIVYGNGDTRPGDEPDQQAVYDAAADVKAAGITIKVVGFDVDAGSSDEEFLETMGDELYIVNESSTDTDYCNCLPVVRRTVSANHW